jgi:hypothetical protein
MMELCDIVSITLGTADSGNLYNTMSIRMAMMKLVTEQDVTSGMAASGMTASGMATSMKVTWRMTTSRTERKLVSDKQRG